ncbi:MAG: zinc ribbon domain-containing protein [Clostridiales bacterium]|nr:zinc ribbon domain-containing protein [Clostridiales bacterium]
MFCEKCGNEINDSAAVCHKCGCPVENNNFSPTSVSSGAPIIKDGEKRTLADCAIVFSVLFPIVGLILGIIGTVKYKTAKLKNKCIAAIPISIVVWLISMFMFW